MRSQITMEFLMLVSMAILGLIVVILIAGYEISDLYRSREYTIGRNKALELQAELYLAAQVHPGYNRTFSLPPAIDGVPLRAALDNWTLVLNTTRYEHVLRIPGGIEGNLIQGDNVLLNRGGKLYLNT